MKQTETAIHRRSEALLARMKILNELVEELIEEQACFASEATAEQLLTAFRQARIEQNEGIDSFATALEKHGVLLADPWSSTDDLR